MGAFAVIAARERELDRDVTLDALAGLGWERPLHGAAMWVFMLSFAGFPLTGGFLGKFTVFSAVYESGWWWLVVVGVIATAVSVAYYLSVVRALYMRPEPGDGDRPRRGWWLTAASTTGSMPLLVAAIAVVVGLVLLRGAALRARREGRRADSPLEGETASPSAPPRLGCLGRCSGTVPPWRRS